MQIAVIKQWAALKSYRISTYTEGTIEENHQSYLNKDKLRHCQNVSYWLAPVFRENTFRTRLRNTTCNRKYVPKITSIVNTLHNLSCCQKKSVTSICMKRTISLIFHNWLIFVVRVMETSVLTKSYIHHSKKSCHRQGASPRKTMIS